MKLTTKAALLVALCAASGLPDAFAGTPGMIPIYPITITVRGQVPVTTDSGAVSSVATLLTNVNLLQAAGAPGGYQMGALCEGSDLSVFCQIVAFDPAAPDENLLSLGAAMTQIGTVVRDSPSASTRVGQALSVFVLMPGGGPLAAAAEEALTVIGIASEQITVNKTEMGGRAITPAGVPAKAGTPGSIGLFGMVGLGIGTADHEEEAPDFAYATQADFAIGPNPIAFLGGCCVERVQTRAEMLRPRLERLAQGYLELPTPDEVRAFAGR